MKIKTKDLKVGTIVSSGETVKGCTRCWSKQYGERYAVTLEKNGKIRSAYWKPNSTIFCKG